MKSPHLCRNGKTLVQGKDGFWVIEGEERRDFTYDHPVKDLGVAICFPLKTANDTAIAIKILDNIINDNRTV